ncbi:uncharacterized protein LOC135564044 [Oncorhynchus nerka]|uniref:uncharacterized protein LOC135564044 n=1 Tax=Oncorhynchus nerka TaxID=8023 RepID=UPI0031B817CF
MDVNIGHEVGYTPIPLETCCSTDTVCYKRKILRLLFTNKKNPMDKLRSVGHNRSSGPSHRDSPRGQPQAKTPPQRQKHSSSIFKPPPQNQHPPGQPYPSHSQRRLPQCSPVHLSHPVPLSPTSVPGPGQPRPPTPPPHRALPPHGPGQPRPPAPPPHRALPPHGPGQPRPPAPPPHRALPPPGQGHAHSHTQAPPRGASFRSVPQQHNSCRMVLNLEIPSPPQKPLPTDPWAGIPRSLYLPTSWAGISKSLYLPTK